MGRTEREPSFCIAHWCILWEHCELEHWEQASAPPGRWTANPESSCPGQATGWPHTSQVFFPIRHLPENCVRQHLLHCNTEAHHPPPQPTYREKPCLPRDTPTPRYREIYLIHPSISVLDLAYMHIPVTGALASSISVRKQDRRVSNHAEGTPAGVMLFRPVSHWRRQEGKLWKTEAQPSTRASPSKRCRKSPSAC